MPIKITRNGLHKLKDVAGNLISSHSEPDEAIEKASSLPNGTYTFEPATKTLKVTGNAAAPAPTPPAPVPPAPPPVLSPPISSASPNGTEITQWSYGLFLTDAAGNKWSVDGDGTTVGTRLKLNGAAIDQAADLLTIIDGVIWGRHVQGDWFTLAAPGVATPQPSGPAGAPTATPPSNPTPPAPAPVPPPLPPASGPVPSGDVVLTFVPYGSATLASGAVQSVEGDSTMRRVALNEHLSAWFETRGGDVLAWVENSTTKAAGITSYAGTLSLSINGEVRASNDITLCARQRTAACLPQRIAGGETPLVARLIDADSVPHYGVRCDESVLARATLDFVPLAQGQFSPVMGNAGYHPSIGLLPEWDVAYLTSADPRAVRSVVIHGLLAGRYPIHFRDDATNDFLKYEDHPNLSFNSSSTGEYQASAAGEAAPVWNTSHHPSIGFLSYLLTGWRYFADEVRFASTFIHFFLPDDVRGFDKGLLKPNTGANTIRGAAWALRTLVQACVVTSGASQYRTAFQNNIDYTHDKYILKPSNPQGFMTPYSDYSGVGDAQFFIPDWMEDFETAAWGYALQRFPSEKLTAFFRWKAKSIVGRLGPAGDPNAYSYRDAAPYTLSISPSDTPDFENGTGPWHKTWGDVYAATIGHQNSDVDGDPRNGYWPGTTAYWGNLFPALNYSVYHKVDGAQEAIDRLRQSPSWAAFEKDFAVNPVWGVFMATAVDDSYSAASGKSIYAGLIDPDDGLPAWLPDAGTFANLGTSTLLSVAPSGWPGGDAGGPFSNWAGGTYAPAFSTLGAIVYHGSGHLPEDTGTWAGVWLFDLDDLTFKGRNVPSAPLLEDLANYNEFGESIISGTEGHTYPAHSYDGLCYQSPAKGGGTQGSLLRASLAGAGFGTPLHKFDLSSATSPPVRVVDTIRVGGDSYPQSAVDEARGGLWYLTGNGNGPLRFVKFSDWSVTTYTGVEYNDYGDQSMVYIPELDCIVGMGRGDSGGVSMVVYVCPIVGGVPQGFTKITQSGEPPSDFRCGGCWSTILQKIVSYQAGGSYDVHMLTPPAGSLTAGTWVWTHTTLTGVSGATPSACTSGTNGAWSRMIEVSAARCFIWCDSVGDVPQAWRLPGM